MKIFKNILKYSIFAGLFLIPFIPFIVPKAMFFPFITGKGFTFRIIVEIVFGLFVILASIAPEYRPKFSWITKSVLLFTLVIFIADLLSVNAYKSLWSNYERMEGFVLIIHLAMFYLVSSSIFQKIKEWKALINTSIVASVFMSFYGISQAAGKFVINQGGDRVDGTLGNASYLAIYLVFHIFLCIYMGIQTGIPKWQKWAYGVAGVLNFIVLYYTATRGAILGLIGGLALSGLIIVFKEKENVFLRKISYWAIGVVLVLILGIFAFRNTSFEKNNFVISRFTTLSITEVKTQGRYFVWPMAMKGFLEKPILGWGQESFNFVFNKYYDPRMYGQEQWFDRTHDVFLDWLIAGGLLGFLAYASMYVALFYYIWRKESLLKLSEKSIFTGMIAAYIFHNIFVFDNLISYVLFFTILAFVHFQSTERKELTGKYYTKTFAPEITNYIVAPVVVILTIVSIYFVNVKAIEANQTLIKAITPQGSIDKNFAYFNQVFNYNSFGSSEALEQLIQITAQVSGDSSQVPQAVKDEFYNLTKQKIEQKIQETPTDARYLVFAGSFFNQFRQYDEGIKYLTRAIVASPNKQSIYFEIGTSYLGKGQVTQALAVFKKAYDLEPASQESKVIYTLGGIYAKDVNVLKQMSTVIDPNLIISDGRFLKAYADIGDQNAVISILATRIQNDPSNVDNKLLLASYYVQFGQKQKAIDIINAMAAQDPTFKDRAALILEQIKNYK